jgi:hypothetical protein
MASLLPKSAISYSTTRGSCLKVNSFNPMLFPRFIAINQVSRVSKFFLVSRIFAAINRLNFSTSRSIHPHPCTIDPLRPTALKLFHSESRLLTASCPCP